MLTCNFDNFYNSLDLTTTEWFGPENNTKTLIMAHIKKEMSESETIIFMSVSNLLAGRRLLAIIFLIFNLLEEKTRNSKLLMKRIFDKIFKKRNQDEKRGLLNHGIAIKFYN